MPALLNRNVRLILGKTGSGKTTLARQFVTGLPRALILDNGFCEFPAVPFLNIQDLHAYLDANGGQGGNFRAGFTPLRAQVATIFQWAREIGNAEEMTLVLEECDRFPTPESALYFEELVQRGRHFGVHLLGLTTHPYAVDIDLRRQATEIFTFRQHEPADLKWLSAVMTPEALDQVMTLGDYEYIQWTARTGAIVKGKTKV
jgi:superfamily II DNA or RNA helicase